MEFFKIDWSSIIVDIVKKKDLDTYEFANCWEENYNWINLDNFVISNYQEELIKWAQTKIECENINFPPYTKELLEDLKNYKTHINKKKMKGVKEK